MKAIPRQNPGEVTLELKHGDEVLMEAATRTIPKSPFDIRNILVPVDFSDCSRKALEYAIPLAREHKAVLSLIHIASHAYSGGVYGGIDYAHLEQDATKEAEAGLEKLVQEYVPDDVPAVTMVRIGSSSQEILEIASALPADMIVISTHGRTGLKHALLGSVAEHVVQRAPCPVLVVREHEREILAA